MLQIDWRGDKATGCTVYIYYPSGTIDPEDIRSMVVLIHVSVMDETPPQMIMNEYNL